MVSEVALPDGNGCDLLKQLRGRQDGSPAAAVVLSGHDEPYWLRAAAEAGYQCYLVKPLFYQDLLAAITRFHPPSREFGVFRSGRRHPCGG